MEYNFLPTTNIKVSKICLGTMTWGRQNTTQEAFDQMNFSLEHGVNFFDTAELYPVPATADKYAVTEEIIGKWFYENKNREKIILATKIAGPGAYTAHIRKTGFKGKSIDEAVDGSLKRLKTDYIDLYQLHWPERITNTFGNRSFQYSNDTWEDNFLEILEKLNRIIKSGKVRQIGLSNENPWGIMKFLEYSKESLPKMITIQNPYSLLNRLFEIGSSEICKRENIGLLGYSPLGFGILTGKYFDNKRIVLVGPSPHLIRKNLGKFIDSFDVVVRVNELGVVGEMSKDYGSRTDISFLTLTDESLPIYMKMKEE